MTKEDVYKIIKKPETECDGYEVHIRHLFKHNDSKPLFGHTTGRQSKTIWMAFIK